MPVTYSEFRLTNQVAQIKVIESRSSLGIIGPLSWGQVTSPR